MAVISNQGSERSEAVEWRWVYWVQKKEESPEAERRDEQVLQETF